MVIGLGRTSRPTPRSRPVGNYPHQAEAAEKFERGALKKVHLDLAHCTIYSPMAGTVISRNTNVGQPVAASVSAPVLFVIANDLTKMQIEAQVAEADVGSVAAGQQAHFNVDGDTTLEPNGPAGADTVPVPPFVARATKDGT